MSITNTLDPAQIPKSGKISPSLLELRNLKYLDLGGNSFEGNYSPIPQPFGKNSSLLYLSLGGNYFLSGGNLKWLSYFPLLRHLDLNMVNLRQAINWPELVNNLPLLENLNLSQCQLPNLIPPKHPFNSSLSLTVVDLSFNSLSSSVYSWLVNLGGSLVDVNLQSNRLNGSIPDAFGKMISLLHLNLAYNEFAGSIPKSFDNFEPFTIARIAGEQFDRTT
ncbi:hypothetical protein Vadar_009334 [Vaccinium darrowii]|nr:hypothetical protein Vadar_009334 [Vaccinium darrowii]